MTNCLCGSYEYQILGIVESKQVCQCSFCSSIWMERYVYSLQYYQEEYPIFYRQTHTPEHDSSVAKNRLSLITPYIQEHTLLDIGSATGAFVRCCRDHGYEAWGIDIMPSHSGFIIQDNINTYSFNRTFGMVTAFDIIEHLPDQRLILSKIQSLAEDFIFIDQPDPETASDIHWKHIKPKEHGFLMSAAFISSCLNQFKLLQRTSQVPQKMSLIYKRESTDDPNSSSTGNR